MPLTNPSFFSINLEFAASTASNAQLSFRDTAIAAQVYPTGGGRIFGPIGFSTIQSASTTTVYAGAGNFGWAGGGGNSSPSQISTVFRVDFNNDTVVTSVRGPLSGARYGLAAIGNNNYAWFGGGRFLGPSVSTVDRIEYSNDSPTAGITRTTIPAARLGLAAVGNDNFGWFGGGFNAAAGQSDINRISYSNDTIAASPRNSLSTSRTSPSATGNSIYGWWVAGALAPGPTPQSIVDRMEFSNDTGALSARAFLPYGRSAMGATSNSNYGWFAGGYTALAANKWSTIQRIDFSNDSPTTASPRGPLSSARYGTGGAGNQNYGWFIAGGGSPVIPAAVSTVDRIDYSNDTVLTSVRGPLSVSIGYQGAASNYVKSEKGFLLAKKIPLTEVWSINTYTTQATWIEIPGTYGWFAGGWTPGASAVVDRIDFANDSPTTASPRGALSQGRTQMGSGNNSNYGWFFGGYVPAAVSTVDRIDFGNDSPTSAIARNSLPAVTGQYPVGMPNGYSYLWMTSSNSIVLRLDFSNDGVAQASRGTYSPSQGQQGGSNQFYGWITGGKPSSRVERIDFSNDSPTAASPRGPLLATRADGTFSGNQNYGWVITGYPGSPPLTGISSVERIDYSNDSPTSPSPRGNIPVSARTQKSSGNANYGWIGGGAPTLSSVYRIDYANDTASATTRGPITVAREMGASSSNYVIGRSQPAGTTTSTAYFPASIVPTQYTSSSVADSGAGTFGWFVGGYGIPNGGRSNVDRISFASDSPTAASPRGQLPLTKSANAGTSNASFGWISGGGSPNADVFRIDFASDLVAASPRASMNSGRQDLAATGNANYGWFGGGAPGNLSRIERIDYASDTTTPSVRGPLIIGRSSGAALGTANYGYWVAGSSAAGPDVSTIDRIDFANDSPTSAITRGSLPRTNRDIAALGTANYGWVSGGYGALSNVWRIDYSNDLTSAGVRGNLSKARANFKGAGNASFGWVGPSSQGDSSIDRIDYANDSPTSASPRGNLSLARFSMAAVSNFVKGASAVTTIITGNAIIYTTGTSTIPVITVTSATAVSSIAGTYGWFGGGSTPTVVSTIERIDFSNDSPTAASTRGPLSRALSKQASVGNGSYGWWAGGYLSFPTLYSTVDRVDFANDSPTAASPRGPLSRVQDGMGAVGNLNYGWFGGGRISLNSPVSYVNRIDYSNDSPTATSNRGGIFNVGERAAATGNADYGWFVGGWLAPGRGSSIERIDFANDSPTAGSTRGPLVVGRSGLSATGDANYGWFAGGSVPGPTSSIERIDFANDSPTSASPRGPLTSSRYNHSGAGNSAYGWHAGGTNPGLGGALSSVDRIDFANDSPTAASPRGQLNLPRVDLSGASNYVKFNTIVYTTTTSYIPMVVNGNYGWFGGGYRTPGIRFSAVDRIDFSNDSPAAASPRGPLSLARQWHGAVSNANYGWYGGGNAFPAYYSTIDRIDFSTDTSATTPRGLLNVGRAVGATVGNANYGWFAGGQNPGVFTGIDRIDYSNDSVVASLRGLIGSTHYNSTGVGNANYGWIAGGGTSSPIYSTVDRIDYANDSPTTASPRGPLTAAKGYTSATGNDSYGWVAGGFTGSLPVSTVERIDFSNDSPASASPRSSLPIARNSIGATGNANYGWFGGGYNGSQVDVSSVLRLDFSNDTSFSTRGTLTSNRRRSSATSNTAKDNRTFSAITGNVGTYGWFAGGNSSSSKVDRIDFANDSPTAASPRGALTTGRQNAAGTANANYGWIAGGIGPVLSSVNRIDFANDSPTSASPRGPLSEARGTFGAAGNANYGWFGGSNAVGNGSIVDRIDYSNDSPATASVRGRLSASKYGVAATGNNNYGWFGGGNGSISVVDRIDYSNDSPTTASPRGPLSQARYLFEAAGNANYGWFGGGYISPGVSSIIDRIDFSNDSPTAASPRSPLSVARYTAGAAGNANYGWFAGGGSPAALSSVERIDWSNDSPTATSPRGLLSSSREIAAAVSNYVQSRTELIASSPVDWPGGTWIRGGLSIV